MYIHVHVHTYGDWLTFRPKGCSQPRELWFFDILMYMYIHVRTLLYKVHVEEAQLPRIPLGNYTCILCIQ